MTNVVGCLACDLTSGRTPPTGGRTHETQYWVVEHCIGPLGVGTLIVKPFRHVLHFADLTPDETAEFGPLIQRIAATITAETSCDQTYICQWAHAGFEVVHLHFVVQPAWDAQREQFTRPGPFLQVDMYNQNKPLDQAEVALFCDRIRLCLNRQSQPSALGPQPS